MNNNYVGLKTKWPYFKYEANKLCGIGKNKIPIISMDKYIDISKNEEMHLECCKGLALTENYKMAMYPGALHISEKLKGKVSFSEMLYNLTDYDPTNIHKKNLEELEKLSINPRQSIYKYMYYAMGADIPWFFALYLREQGFSQKLKKPIITWNDNALKYFPKFKPLKVCQVF